MSRMYISSLSLGNTSKLSPSSAYEFLLKEAKSYSYTLSRLWFAGSQVHNYEDSLLKPDLLATLYKPVFMELINCLSQLRKLLEKEFSETLKDQKIIVVLDKITSMRNGCIHLQNDLGAIEKHFIKGRLTFSMNDSGGIKYHDGVNSMGEANKTPLGDVSIEIGTSIALNTEINFLINSLDSNYHKTLEAVG